MCAHASVSCMCVCQVYVHVYIGMCAYAGMCMCVHVCWCMHVCVCVLDVCVLGGPLSCTPDLGGLGGRISGRCALTCLWRVLRPPEAWAGVGSVGQTCVDGTRGRCGAALSSLRAPLTSAQGCSACALHTLGVREASMAHGAQGLNSRPSARPLVLSFTSPGFLPCFHSLPHSSTQSQFSRQPLGVRQMMGTLCAGYSSLGLLGRARRGWCGWQGLESGANRTGCAHLPSLAAWFP